MAFYSRQWTRQPSESAKVNWSNPLARGLVSLLPFDRGADAVTGAAFGTSSAGQSLRATPAGVGVASNNAGLISYPVSTRSFSTNELTLAFYGSSASNLSFPDFLSVGAGSTSFVTLERAGTTTSDTEAGLYPINTNTGGLTSSAGAVSLLREVPYVLVGVASAAANTSQIYSNGKSFGAGLWGGSASATSVQYFSRHGGGDARTLNNSFGLLAAGWGRALSPDEVASFSANPWQLFAPRRIWVPQAAITGLPTLSLPTYVPGSLTATGFRPRVTAS